MNDRDLEARRRLAEQVRELEIENMLLREAFAETQVTFEDSRVDAVELSVDRTVWLRLRAWRVGDRTRPSRFVLFSDEELHALEEMTSSRTTSQHLTPYRRVMMAQVITERQRRQETS